MATALADVLAADRNLARLENACWPREDEAMQCARNELETASEALIAAMDEHLQVTIIRAVAAMAQPHTRPPEIRDHGNPEVGTQTEAAF